MDWTAQLTEPGMTRAELGRRIIAAYAAGLTRSSIAAITGLSADAIADLAAAAR